ncbi:MAG: hypothetical protein NC429_17200 [Lachnospiraceae bacterium]|nr:hypothetical protein [Lachnospiraceae bacterium]
MKIGYDVFGKSYGIMLRNDVHAGNSIDDIFIREMVLLDDDSYLYLYSQIKRFDMTQHELFGFAGQFRGKTDRETITKVIKFTSEIAMEYNVDFKDMLFGGTELQIIERGTDWCADMARVCAVLLQCCNIPCRIVHLANLEKAYNGHVVCEAYYEGRYGIIDPIYGYMFYDNVPISAYDVTKNKKHLQQYGDGENYGGLYSAIAINEYDPTNGKNVYTVSAPNAYYLKLIYTEHNDQWIMGEDR